MISFSEEKTWDYLKGRGYYFMRSARSFGVFDFVASNDKEILFIQAKCNQAPRKAELDALRRFRNYPKNLCVKKQVWIWKKYKKDPVIMEVPR